jgi:hypothetical protein
VITEALLQRTEKLFGYEILPDDLFPGGKRVVDINGDLRFRVWKNERKIQIVWNRAMYDRQTELYSADLFTVQDVIDMGMRQL